MILTFEIVGLIWIIKKEKEETSAKHKHGGPAYRPRRYKKN